MARAEGRRRLCSRHRRAVDRAQATGNRPCERLIGRYFGRYQAFCHSANTSNPHFAGRSRALRIAQALNLAVDPDSSGRSNVNRRTWNMIQAAENLAGFTFVITQGSYNKGVSASAGTHDGGRGAGGLVILAVAGIDQGFGGGVRRGHHCQQHPGRQRVRVDHLRRGAGGSVGRAGGSGAILTPFVAKIIGKLVAVSNLSVLLTPRRRPIRTEVRVSRATNRGATTSG